MFPKSFIERIFVAAQMQRWNDHIRPMDFMELDKQAHKMIVAYVLGRRAEDSGVSIDWDLLIKGGLFEFFSRVTLTDIKPNVYEALMSSKGLELHAWVGEELKPDFVGIDNGRLHKELVGYLTATDKKGIERQILNAAHYLATAWEFEIIYNMAPFIYGIAQSQQRIEAEIEEHLNLDGVEELGAKIPGPLKGFVDLCGQLRFQTRWAQTPRIPQTSVLGHMLMVGIFSYCATLEITTCKKRRYNNFFAGLFHDLPEVLTRDIISPVKRAVPGLEDIVKEFEEAEVAKRLLPLLPQSWHEEVRYFIEDEFSDRICIDGKKQLLEPGSIAGKYDSDTARPVDGALIEIMDKLSAFAEASMSIDLGVASKGLAIARLELIDEFGQKVLHDIDFGSIFNRWND